MQGLVGQLARLNIRTPGSYSRAQKLDRQRLQSWEMNQIDYMGADAFANIQARLDEALEGEGEEELNLAPSTPFSSKTDLAEGVSAKEQPEGDVEEKEVEITTYEEGEELEYFLDKGQEPDYPDRALDLRGTQQEAQWPVHEGDETEQFVDRGQKAAGEHGAPGQDADKDEEKDIFPAMSHPDYDRDGDKEEEVDIFPSMSHPDYDRDGDKEEEVDIFPHPDMSSHQLKSGQEEELDPGHGADHPDRTPGHSVTPSQASALEQVVEGDAEPDTPDIPPSPH